MSIFGTGDGKRLWTVGDKGTILRSDDGGGHWTPLGRIDTVASFSMQWNIVRFQSLLNLIVEHGLTILFNAFEIFDHSVLQKHTEKEFSMN
jgi:hypothetical protein